MFNQSSILASQISKTQINGNQSSISVGRSKGSEKKSEPHNFYIKNPPLSIPSQRPVLERRSGLQDVDEAYLRQNMFARPFYRKTSASQGGDVTGASKVNLTKDLTAKIDGNISRERGGAIQNTSPMWTQEQSPKLITAQTPDEETEDNQKFQPLSNEQPQQKEELTQLKVSPNMLQQVYLPVIGKAEMCTTCPNCRALIYLVRGGVNFFQSNQDENRLPERMLNNLTGKIVEQRYG